MKSIFFFVFFMICNFILGLGGIGILSVGLFFTISANISKKIVERWPFDSKILEKNVVSISGMVIGIHIMAIFILGICSKNERRILIAYFVLILALFIVEIAMTIVFNNLRIKYPTVSEYDICTIAFGVSGGFGFLTFILSLIYFILKGKENNSQLDAEVRNMEYINIPENQLV